MSLEDDWSEEFIVYEFEPTANATNVESVLDSGSNSTIDVHYDQKDSTIYLSIDHNVYLGKVEEVIGTNIILQLDENGSNYISFINFCFCNVNDSSAVIDKDSLLRETLFEPKIEEASCTINSDNVANTNPSIKLFYHSSSSKVIKSEKVRVVAMRNKTIDNN